MLLATILALAAPLAAVSMHHDAACPAVSTPLPAGMSGWARPSPVAAGADAARATPLAIGAAAAATLLPTPGIAYAVRPEQPGGPASRGGVFAFMVASGGRYRVALGAGAWIDVLSGTTPVASVAHGHGPACSTIRKMVDFDLRPGRYLLQVAGSEATTLPLMVARMR